MDTKKKYEYNITEICMSFLEGRRFYATILSKLVKIKSNKIETAAVGFNEHGKLTLYYNEDFLLGLPLKKAQAVLEHEVLHIFFRHPTRFPFKDITPYIKRINNMGCDVAINQYIDSMPEATDFQDFFKRNNPEITKEELDGIKGCLYPETYDLPRERNADFYIEELKKKMPEQKRCPKCGMPMQQQGQGKQKKDQQGQGQGNDQEQQEQKQGKGKGKGKQDQGQEQGQQGQGEHTCPECGQTPSQGSFDDHSFWDKVIDTITGEIKEAKDCDVDPEYEVQTTILKAIKECKDFGKLPAFVEKEIEALKKINRYNWKHELRVFVNSVLSVHKRLSQKRVNRRFAAAEYILPGKKKARKPRLLLARDTSGSVFNEETQNDFLNEMLAISNFCDVMVCDCDTKIHQTYKVKKMSDFKKYKGGGGTSFKPVFEEAKKLHVDGIVYLTDTYGDFPEKSAIGKFASKTIWVTVEQEKVEIPFGKHVNITKTK